MFALPTPAIPTELLSRLGKVSQHSLISRLGAERSSSSQQLGAAPAVRKSRMQDLRQANKEVKKSLTLWWLKFYPVLLPNIF